MFYMPQTKHNQNKYFFATTSLPNKSLQFKIKEITKFCHCNLKKIFNLGQQENKPN